MDFFDNISKSYSSAWKNIKDWRKLSLPYIGIQALGSLIILILISMGIAMSILSTLFKMAEGTASISDVIMTFLSSSLKSLLLIILLSFIIGEFFSYASYHYVSIYLGEVKGKLSITESLKSPIRNFDFLRMLALDIILFIGTSFLLLITFFIDLTLIAFLKAIGFVISFLLILLLASYLIALFLIIHVKKLKLVGGESIIKILKDSILNGKNHMLGYFGLFLTIVLAISIIGYGINILLSPIYISLPLVGTVFGVVINFILHSVAQLYFLLVVYRFTKNKGIF